MKTTYNERPEAIASVGRGKYYVNMDVAEIHPEGEEGVLMYECDYVETSGTPTYPMVVEALIRERYTVSDELALLRQQATKSEEFAEYNTYCEDCKAKARAVFQSGEGGE